MKPEKQDYWFIALAFLFGIGLVGLSVTTDQPAAPEINTLVSKTGVQRSPRWPAVRKEHLKTHPACEACGRTDDLDVHHIVPFHVNPSKELDPTNLITLCRKHHFEVGHDPDGPWGPKRPGWLRANPRVKADAQRLRNSPADVSQAENKE